MSRTDLRIDGQLYQFARTTPEPEGGRQITIDNVPWQPGDPADKKVALWHSDGPNLYSQEDVSETRPEGHLAVDYCDGTDSRWSSRLTLGPELKPLSLSSLDQSFPMTFLNVSAALDSGIGLDATPISGSVNDIVLTPGAITTEAWIYYARDGYVTKVNAITLAVAETHAMTDSVTALLATQTPGNLREVSVGLQTSPYQVIAPIATTGTLDTYTANTGSAVANVFGTDPLRVVRGYMSGGQTVFAGNALTSVVTMGAPAWFDVTTITGQSVVPTGFTTDGSRWVMGTSGGPYYIDPSLGQPYELLPSLGHNTENARQLFYWEFLGAIIMTRYGVRYQRGTTGKSFGVETFEGNRSPVQGYVTAADGSQRWLYTAVSNTITGNTWLVAWHTDSRETRQTATGPVVMSPFVIGRIPSSQPSRAMQWIGTANQLRTSSLLTMGAGSDALTMIAGETPQEIDDPNYRYQASGDAYMTEMRRFPHLLKDVEALEFEASGCTTNNYITPSITVYGDTSSATTTVNGSATGVNDTIKTNGYQRRLFVDNAGNPLTSVSGRRVKPKFSFTLGDTYGTNLCTNPSFETGTTGWTVGSGSIAQSSSQAKFGAYSLGLTLTVGSPSSGYSLTLTGGYYYTFSAYVYVPSTVGGTKTASITTLYGSGLSGSSTSSLTDQWQRLSYTIFIQSTGTYTITFGGNFSSGTAYIDGVQIEQGSSATAYIDGTQTNCVWNGTANASTSTRSVTEAPSIIGPIRMYYTLRPILVDKVTLQLQLQDDDQNTAYDKINALQALQNRGPVYISDDYFGDSWYGRVADIKVPPEVKAQGGSPDRPKEGGIYVVPVTIHRWQTEGNGIEP